ncbi:MAG: diaminopimelate decarboxylase [Clostridia bacterium]|nr:diaminopimelate decarboxylase [Clostridia bacterium]
MICENISISKDGILEFAGVEVTQLAEKYGTPLYLLDEERIRNNCRIYKEVFKKYFGEDSYPLFASKALSFKGIYRIMEEEGMGIDVVSIGEMYTALKAGYDLSKAYFHSNNKTDDDIAYAMDNKIGCFVADNVEEIKVIEREAEKRGIIQKVMLRITPGIDPHTYKEVATGKVDSKFGSAIETNQAHEITHYTIKQPHCDLIGFHCHVGSQVFGENIFERAAFRMIDFIAELKRELNFDCKVLDLGGGFGVKYTEDDPDMNLDEKIADVAEACQKACKRYNVKMPAIHMEPGRSLVADAGMTLYTVGTVKQIPGFKNYVSVDGGMADNPRYAFYRSAYTCYIANKMFEEADMKADLVGRCCESGDIIQPDIMVPSSVGRYDIAAVCTTGAYNYSMASNYNKLGIPPIVMLNRGKDKLAVRRESLEDLISRDI